MRTTVAAALAALAAGVVANGINNHVVHESRTGHVHSSWQRGERVEADAIVPIRIGLKQNNLEKGGDVLMDISHPSSKNYGKHLSADQVFDLFAPSADAVNAVREWLISAGVDARMIAHSDNKGWLAADVPAKHAEELFHTELYEYEHSESGSLRMGCDSYSLPGHIQEHVDFITPGVKFSAPLRKRSNKRSESWGGPKGWPKGGPQHHRPQWAPMPTKPWHMPPPAYTLPAELQNCGVNITPPCLRALYGIPVAHINDSVNTLGVFAQGDYYSGADIDSYFAMYQPRVPQGTRPVLKSVDGATTDVEPTDPNNTGESDIDFDITISLVYPQTVNVYQVDDDYYAPLEVALDNTFNTFLDALDGSYCNYSAYGITGDSDLDPVYPDNHTGGYKGQRQCGVYKPTRVITASYGESEGDFPVNYVRRQCNEFMKLALQGHTMFFSSGDYAVANPPGDPTASGCLSGSGQNQTIFNPGYPVGCPWVTAVGATQLYANQTVLDAESSMAVDLWRPGRADAFHYFASAGGFSNDFAAPSYQSRAISTWRAKYDPGYPTYVANANVTNIGSNGGLYNRAGRGFPDVSANGAYMPAYVNQSLGHWFGSSLASPIWASVTTLINQQRTIAGKGPVGFINPVLYEHPWALNDIVNGSNPNCGSAGFHSVPGWDPVTGLGTPNYPKLLELFLSLP